MTKNRKIIIIWSSIIFISICAGVLIFVNFKNINPIDKSAISSGDLKSASQDYLIDQYPIKDVPLYKSSKIESSKFYYNSDPVNTSAFDESPFSYFNVVYETTASKNDIFSYYRSIFDKQINEEFSNDDSIKGVIGKYQIEVSQYGDNTVYMQVYVQEKDSDVIKNDIFGYFPVVDIDRSYSKLNEKSYGLLNQKGGEIEYTHYYTVSNTGDINGDNIDDINEFSEIQSIIQEKYKNNTDFSFKDNVFEWLSDKNEKYTVSLSADHGRVYVQIRKPI